ncbi:hypothetical protein [Actinomycetospora soli]|uniref:hypothetical protein n=1 Tax=Actinomycetospora soli TaxID=2893887 RepID=UPI001E64B64A|nr:hypothetical protein [Actinomycetospora soli]MCD2185719.1 hypothetical protein [Actinomycetospora soli]
MRRPRPRRRPVRVAGDRRGGPVVVRRARTEELAVQLPGTFLDDPDLAGLVPGCLIDAAPALFVAETLPAGAGRDGWNHDDLGLVRAQGTVLTALPSTDGPAPVSVLDAGERLFPLFWSTAEPRAGHLAVAGALYLDPELAPGTEHGEQVALCRERYRVTAIRLSSRLSWRPEPARQLSEVPRHVDEDLVLVVGLLPVGAADTRRRVG